MRQVVQHLRTGAIELLELPAPRAGAHEVVIRTRRSLLSAGTERMLLEFGRAGLIGKALKQPERVRLLLERLRSDGVGPVLEGAFNKLDEPLPLGYASAGVVIEAGTEVRGLRPGERVVSNAPHAGSARVGANLCARIPDSVSDEQAAFVVPAAIGLQGVRLAEPTLSETFAVTGAGLIGLLTVQLLTAAGCAVIGIDTRADRLELAGRFGARTVPAGRRLGARVRPRAHRRARRRWRARDGRDRQRRLRCVMQRGIPGRCRKMLTWYAAVRHTDGGIPLINDSALDVAMSFATLEAYARRHGLAAPGTAPTGLTLLRAAGYGRIAVGPWCLLLDVGSVGPAYQPGHAHAGTLSYELSVGVERIVVDTGVSTYRQDEVRARERSTAAHNTVTFDAVNSFHLRSGGCFEWLPVRR